MSRKAAVSTAMQRRIGAIAALLAGVGASLLVLEFLGVVNVRRCFCDAEVQLILAVLWSVALATLFGFVHDADRASGLCALIIGIVGQVGAGITLSVIAISDRRFQWSDLTA